LISKELPKFQPKPLTIELIGVEIVGGKEHRKEQNNPGIHHKGLVEANNVRLQPWVNDLLYFSPIFSNDPVTGSQEATEQSSGCLQDNKANVGSIGDMAGLDTPILTQRYRSSDDCTKVEKKPSNRDGATSLRFDRVRLEEDTSV
jgi:hypothetical protein